MKNLLTLVLLTLHVVTSAQNLDLFEKRTYKAPDGQILPYRLLYPENYDKSQKYPLLLFLHGAGERGNDNEKQLVHGSKLFLSEAARRDFPCFILMPQCPADSYWSSVKIDREKMPLTLEFDYTEPPTAALKMAMEVLRQIVGEESVDQSRLYVAGLSMGGMGTFETVFRHPKLFAAAMPICGGGDVKHYDKRVKKVPFWVFHGEKDVVVEARYSREMAAKLKQLKVDVRYTEYPGVNHNSWDNAFAEPEFLSWLLTHRNKKAKF